MKNNLNKLTDKVKERVIKQIQPKVAEQIKTAFAELEKDWAIRERYIKEQTKKEILDIIENINWADVFDGTSYDVVENEVCGHDTFWSKEDLNRDLKLRIKQQLNQPKTEQ